MEFAVIGQAAVMFAVTNVDDLLILAVFFGRAPAERSQVMSVVVGQYLGFVAILAVAVPAALGAALLPERVLPYLGLLPVALGLRAGWSAWRERHGDADDEAVTGGRVRAWQVAAVTFANGGDNIGVYVPVFAVAGPAVMTGYVGVFLIGVAAWCLAGWYLASRRPVAEVLTRWGHVLLPVVLIAVGLVILVEGGAFGL